jgi:hypothetical protein
MKWFYLTLLLTHALSLYAPCSPHFDFEPVKVYDPYKVTLFTDKMSNDFINKVESVCRELEIPSDWLVGVMWHESRLNSKIVNRIGATGLIQFLPSTAKGLNTTTKKLLEMSDTAQLNYVGKFYKNMKGLCRERTDLYLYTFFPSAILGKWSNSAVLKSATIAPASVAYYNPGLDHNKDGVVTVGEFRLVMNNKISKLN